MEDLTIDTFLESLINLTAASGEIPSDFDFKFCALDEEFQSQADELAQRTLNLSKELTTYILEQPPSELDEEFTVDVDAAINQLLGSRVMDILDKKPPPPVSFKGIEKKTIGNIKFIYSPTVTKPPKVVKLRQLPESVPTLEVAPVVVTPDPPELNISCLSVVATPQNLREVIDKVTSTCGGVVYLAWLSHRVRTYRPFECFCVLMTPSYSVYIVDLIELRHDLDPLVSLLQANNIVKVMYAPDESLRVVAESLGVYVAPVVDACAAPGVPLEDAIADRVTLKKCVVDWRLRPLNDDLSLVAATSVFYLPSLLNKKLGECNGDDLIAECRRFAKPPPSEYSLKEPEREAIAAEIVGDESLSETAMTIIRELISWRDSVANLEDESPNFIAGNSMLKNIAKNVPLTNSEMDDTLKQGSTVFLDSYKSDLLLIVKRACDYEEQTLTKILSVGNHL